MAGPSWRDVEREIDQVEDDPDPEEADKVKVWRAFLNSTHPHEMETQAEADLLRRHWTAPLKPETDPRDMTGEEIGEFDARIRRVLETGDRG